MWTLSYGVHFFRALVVDVSAQQFFGKHIALQQKGVLALQGIQSILE
jgi:hypothetical protein